MIGGWSHETEGQRETITVQWNEPGTFDVTRFPQARQLVTVLPKASIAHETPRRFQPANSSALSRARLQEVTLPDGTAGIQLTLHFNQWVDVETHAGDGALTFSYPAPESSTAITPASLGHAQSSPPGGGHVFTDAKIDQLDSRDYGSWDAPPLGAGQAGAEGGIGDYYVPPAVDRVTDPRTAGRDIGEVAIQSKLNETVLRVDFQGTSLENVIRLISEQAEINLLVRPADVAGRTVTLRLRNVTLRQMLDAILKANDLGYTIEEGGILRIVPREQVKSTTRETVTETIPINWVDAAEVAASLSPFIDQTDGTIQVTRANNTIIVRDVPENLVVIQDLVSRIDVPEKQVLIELRLVNMTETARRAIGTRTEFRTQDTINRLVADPATGAVGTENITQNVSSGSTFSNSSGRNISNSFNITDSSTNRTFNRSITDNLTSAASAGATGSASAASTLAQTSEVLPHADGSIGLLAPDANAFGVVTRGSLDIFGRQFDVAVALNAQEERGEAVTLANPTVLSLNNQPASVEIQRQIPYVSAVNTDQGSVGTVEFKNVGTKVDVTPRITNNGYIIMNVMPEQIIDTGDRPQGVPVTDERRVEASVIVKDETTIALGGLRQFESTSSEAGVPYLLRVPVLSWLFKNQSNAQNKTELYLFVTPHIVKDPTPPPYQQALYDKIDYNWDLPDYFFDDVIARKAPGEDQRDNGGW